MDGRTESVLQSRMHATNDEIKRLSLLFNTSKGSFCSRKKIIKVLFPGVSVCGSCDLLESRCVGVAVCRSCGVWEMWYVGVVVCGSCSV